MGLGVERKGLYYPVIKNKSAGVVANTASVINGINTVDQLIQDSIRVIKIFSPEHGFRMNSDAGANVEPSVDSDRGLEVISLYGKNKKPLQSDLKNIDIIVFDLQDIGVRFFTYISTLTYVMESCAENNIPLIVLDRPNPHANYVDGPVLEKQFKSFVGLHPVPVVYGMTIGEYALMVNGEHWLENDKSCSLTVIPIENYQRNDLTMPEIKPSPNLPNLNAIILYPSLCFFEGTVVSVGRGTSYPFEVYGHPDLKSETFSFIPESIAGMSMDPPFKGEICFGKDLRGFAVANMNPFNQLKMKWLIDAYRKIGSKSQFFNNYFNTLAGTATLQEQIKKGFSEKKIRASWKPGLDKFMKIRKKYLIY